MKVTGLILGLILCIGFTASAQTGTISLIPDISYSQRDTFFVVNVTADEYLKGIKAIELDIDVDSSVIQADVAHILLGSIFFDSSDSTFFSYRISSGKQRLTIDIAVLGNGLNKSGPGNIASIRFNTIGFGETDLIISSVKVRDTANVPIPVNLVNAWGKVCRYVGDIDADNRIDITDLSYLIDYLIDLGSEPIPYEVANMDCHDIVDISDLSLLINYLTGGGAQICRICL
jgi:hypothetical protein